MLIWFDDENIVTFIVQDNNVDDTKVITELLLQSDLDSNANDWGHIAEVVELEIDYDVISIVPECVDKFQKIVHSYSSRICETSQ